MNDKAAKILISLVARYGTSLASDPLRCEGLLRDTCSRCGREIFVLVNAVRQQVPADLLAPRHTLPPALFRGFLVKRLQDELAFSDEAARWAVETWAAALGVGDGTDTDGTMAPAGTPVSDGAGDPHRETGASGPEQRSAWVRDLESGSAEVPLEAIRQMAVSGDYEVVPLLITALEHPSWRVREAAFDTLAGIGEPAVPGLIEALADSHEHIVVSSILVLGTIRARAAVDALVALLDGGGEPAACAIWVLGEIGDPRAITPLTRLLTSSNPQIRSEAEQALRKFG